mmetsp:Transcript_4858/g.13520  ORF Transcript_4858/g.13520 Transcript_4858/m.13520 type:complete len:137 (-) Transcript_4858:236-646(-)
MADLIDMSPVASPGRADTAQKPDAAESSEATKLFADFDPLSDSHPAASAPAAAGGGLGMPKAVADAFAAASAGGAAAGGQQKEYLPSGLSVEGQAQLMRQIEESAKQMAKTDGADADKAAKKVDLAEFGAPVGTTA